MLTSVCFSQMCQLCPSFGLAKPESEYDFNWKCEWGLWPKEIQAIYK
jgi:hypothetical protein